MPDSQNKPAQLADGIPPLPTLADRNAQLEARTLQKGDIVAHESEPDLCGYICGRTETGAYIVDYSISMPPTEAVADELIVIKKFDKPAAAAKRPRPGSTEGYVRTLYKEEPLRLLGTNFMCEIPEGYTNWGYYNGDNIIVTAPDKPPMLYDGKEWKKLELTPAGGAQ